MSLVLQLLARYWYVPIAMAIAGAGVHILDSTSYARLQASFATYRTQVAQADSTAQKAARDALQAQIDLRLAAEARNATILHDFNDTQARADAAARDAEFSKRLLQAARATSPTAASPVSEACNRPAAPGAAADRSNQRLAEGVRTAAAECRVAIATLRALQAQLKPQL